MTQLYLAAPIKVQGKELYFGQIGQAQKNLFVWKCYAYPVDPEDVATTLQPAIIKSGRAKTLAKAEYDLTAFGTERFKDVMTMLHSIILEEQKPPEGEDSVKIDYHT